MQSISVYLYSNSIDVFTNAQAAWKTERYRRVYNRNIKIFRGVDNRIDLQIKNSDERRAEVSSLSTVVFNLVDSDSQKIVAQKDCTTVSTSTGRFYVTLTELELIDIEPGFYQYSCVLETRTDRGDGTYIVTARDPLYIDTQYDALATIEVLNSVSGNAQPSQTIEEFNSIITIQLETDFFTSGIIDARPQFNTPQTLHTFQMYFSDYIGDVVLQGSLDDGGSPRNWADLETISVTDDVTTTYTNATGKYNWFRFSHTPDESNTGTFDKILYR
jgi:hypothetical protein